ncbi:small hydrophobic protein [Streptomyces sp. NPDC059373]
MPVRTSTRTDTGTLAVIGVICAIAGFFVLGIVLGPVAIVCGWLAMGRTWGGSKSIPAVVALVLGGIDTIVALLWLTGAGWGGGL